MPRDYLCLNADKSGYDTCPIGNLPAAEIEAAVIDQLSAVSRSPEIVAQTFGNVRNIEQKERSRLEGKRAGLKARLATANRSPNRCSSPGSSR